MSRWGYTLSLGRSASRRSETELEFIITETKWTLLRSFRSYEYTGKVNPLTETVSLIINTILVH